MAEPTNTMTLSGWGRYPSQTCDVYRPEKRASIQAALSDDRHSTFIARGLGRSYGDPAIENSGGAVVLFERLNRILGIDEENAIIHCEAGVSFAGLVDTFLPRGYFVPVTPGTKFVTVGGAIAHDVHGKNHQKDGTFGQAVTEIELMLPSGEVLICTPDGENSDVFWATVGGAGLTGMILSAKFRMQRVETGYFKVDYQKTKNLRELMDVIDATHNDYQYSVAWVDCIAHNGSLGRSVLMQGNHLPLSELPSNIKNPLDTRVKHLATVPFDMPQFLLNSHSMKLFNAAYYRMSSSKQGAVVDWDSYFYPLDTLHHWHRLYGRRGFLQYQFTIPVEHRDGMIAMLEEVSQRGNASFLAVFKKFGAASRGLLSYPSPGYFITLDFPIRDGLVPWLHELDEKLLGYGARLYLAKDAVMKPETFRAMYPRLEEFQEIRRRLDPDGRLASRQARRLGIV